MRVQAPAGIEPARARVLSHGRKCRNFAAQRQHPRALLRRLDTSAVDIRGRGRLLRIGHRGAAALAPGNTLLSIERAIDAGVDVVEVDVVDLEDGTLVLAHSHDLLEVSQGAVQGRFGGRSLTDLRALAPELASLDEALSFLGTRAPGVGLLLDLKRTGYERAAVESLRRHEAVDRALVSSFFAGSLRRIAALEPGLTRAWTYPYDRLGMGERRGAAPLRAAALAALRRALAPRIGRMLLRAEADAACLNHGVISRGVVDRCHELGAAVLAWTVDDEATLARMEAAGVDAVVTNDPRIFRATLRP